MQAYRVSAPVCGAAAVKRTTSAMLFVFAIGCGALGSGGAEAATVQDIVGTIQVNRGSGYQAVSGPTTANYGDLVVARPNSSAVIVYEDGCRQKVEPGRVVAVGAPNQLRSGGSIKDEQVQRQCEQAFAIPHDHYILGAVAVGVGVGIVVTDKKKPASP